MVGGSLVVEERASFMREPSRPTHRTPHTSSNLMTIPDLSANADIVVIGFGGTTPVKVRLKLPPAVCFLLRLPFSAYYFRVGYAAPALSVRVVSS